MDYIEAYGRFFPALIALLDPAAGFFCAGALFAGPFAPVGAALGALVSEILCIRLPRSRARGLLLPITPDKIDSACARHPVALAFGLRLFNIERRRYAGRLFKKAPAAWCSAAILGAALFYALGKSAAAPVAALLPRADLAGLVLLIAITVPVCRAVLMRLINRLSEGL